MVTNCVVRDGPRTWMLPVGVLSFVPAVRVEWTRRWLADAPEAPTRSASCGAIPGGQAVGTNGDGVAWRFRQSHTAISHSTGEAGRLILGHKATHWNPSVGDDHFVTLAHTLDRCLRGTKELSQGDLHQRTVELECAGLSSFKDGGRGFSFGRRSILRRVAHRIASSSKPAKR
jgi:hypothetical protein